MSESVKAQFNLYGTAKQVFSAREDEVLYCGPAGTGKSFAVLLKVHLFALINPNVRILIVRKTAASLGSTALDTYRKHIAKDALLTGSVTYYGGSAAEPPQYRYENGSVILIGGMDNPMKVMSAEYDMIYAQEATELSENDWEALTTRLRNGQATFQQLIADANPDTSKHWLKKRCDRGLTKIINSRHEDNPMLFNQETGEITDEGRSYMGKLDRLTGVRYLRLRKGIWAAAEGLVYDEFDPAIHLIDRFEVPSDWTRWWSVDFGYTNPFVCQMWAEDPDGRLYLYREVYWTGRTSDDHAKHILKLVTDGHGNWLEPKPRGIIADHSAESRELFEREIGMSTTLAYKAVSDGVQRVKNRLMVAGDGKPRLYIMRDSVDERDPILEEVSKPASTEEEIIGYIWDTTTKIVKETPVKMDDHGMDAMRYIVAERDMSSRPRIRSLGARKRNGSWG